MPNEYDDLLGAGFAQDRPATNEYDSILSAAPSIVRAQNAETAAPDDAAKTLEAAKRLGIPYAVGALDHRDTQLQAKRQANQAVITKNPFQQDYIDRVPQAAEVSNDDWDKLDGFSKAWHVFTDPDGVGRLATMLGAPAISAGAQRGVAAERSGSARALGNVAQAQALEQQAAGLPEYPTGVAHYMDMVGGLIGQFGYQAATGGALGAAAGTPAGPAGMAAGFLGGIAAASAQSAYGRSLMAMEKAEQESGQTVDPKAKHLAAGAVGLLSGAANFIGVKAGGEAVATLVADAAATALTKPGVSQALMKFGTDTAKGGVMAGGLMGGLTAAEGILQDAAKSVDGNWQTIYNDPAKRGELVGHVATALADGFVLGGALHAIPAGRNLANDIRLTKEAAADKASLNELIKTRAESATAQRSPESFAGYADLHGDDKLTITAEGVAQAPEALQALGAQPLPDGSVEVPLSTYAAMVPEDVHAKLADDIIHREDGLSVNQAKELKGSPLAGGFLSREQPALAANEAGGVFDTWESRREKLDPNRPNEYTEELQQVQTEFSARVDEIDRLTAEGKLDEADAADRAAYGLHDRLMELTKKSLEAGQKLESLPDYQTGKPTVVDAFHGTLRDFIHTEGFDDAKLGTATNAPSAGEATFFARNPETSNHYARVSEGDHEPFNMAALSTKERMELHRLDSEYDKANKAYQEYVSVNGRVDDDHPMQQAVDKAEAEQQAFLDKMAETHPFSPQLINARVRFENPLVYDFKGQDYREESYYNLIVKAKAEGHDGAIFLNTQDGGPNDVIYAVFKGSNIGHRLDSEARRAATGAERWLTRSAEGEVMPANDLQGMAAQPGGQAIPKVERNPNIEIKQDAYSGDPADKSVIPKGVAEDDTPNRVGINFTEADDAIRITGSYLPEAARGQGNGMAMYEELARYAQEQGKPVYSDYDISPDALRMYKKLRDKGYDVEFAPGARIDETGDYAGFKGKFVGGPDDTFTVRINPKAAEAVVAPDPIAIATTAAESEMYLQPLFQGPAALLMQKGEFARYNKLLEAKANERHAALVRRAEADARARQTPDYLARVADVTEEVTRNVDDRPVFVAERLARTGLDADGTRLADAPGAFKLDRELVDAMSRPGTADLLRGLVKKGGIHPDELAGMVGYGNGPEMIQELLAAQMERDANKLSPKQYREAVIKAEVQERMLDRFGDLDENVRAEALDAAVRPSATELLDAEREALATLAGGKPEVGLDQMRANAAAAFGEAKATDAVNLGRYTRAVGRAGRQAELALLKGDYAKAFIAKQQQMQAMLFAEQAKAFAREQAKAARRLEPYARNPTLPAVAQDYVDQIQGLLVSLGQEVRRDSRDLTEVLAGTTLDSFIAEKNGLLGGIIPNADLPRKGYADYTVVEAQQLADLVQALDYQGRKAEKLRAGDAEDRLQHVVQVAVDNLRDLRDKYDPNAKGPAALIAKLGRKIDAPLLKMEQMFEWFDRHNSQGPFHKYVVEPLHLAQGKRDDLFEGLGRQLKALRFGKAWEKSLGDSLPNTTLIDSFTGKPRELTRKDLLGIMLNSGNGGNMTVLTKGHGWSEQSVRDYITQHARKEDWQWVQGIWNTFKSLEPEIKKTYRELAGVGPEMIQPNKYFTPFGTVEGGYYPLIKDMLRTADQGSGENAFMQRGQIQPFPANGYAKARTGATYPIELNPDYIAANLRAVAHDLAFRGPVIEAHKFLMHPEIQDAVKKSFGPEYAAEIFPYLRDIANDGVSDVAGIAQLTRVSQGARNAVVASLIGLNPGTVMIHGMSAGFNSIGELVHTFGFRQGLSTTPQFIRTIGAQVVEDIYNKTVAKLTQSPAAFNKAWHHAMEESAEMRNRRHNFDRDLNVMQNEALGKKSRIAAWNNFATGFVAYGDLLSAIPTYIAARDLALAKGMSLPDAIALGEKTVRQAHGSAGITDRARIQRGSEAQKWFTMFYGYFSHNYNRNRNTWREAMEGKDAAFDKRYVEAGNAALKVTTAAMFYALLPAVNHAIVRHPKTDDQSWMHWMAAALTTQFTGLFPYVREVGTSVATGFDPGSTPMTAALKSISKTITNGLYLAQGQPEKVKHGAIKEAVNTAGLVGGVGIRQFGIAGQFAYDVQQNKEHPEGFWEWFRGLSSGHAKQKAKH